MSSNNDSPPCIRDQYHHMIPRFILRRFQISPLSPFLNRKEREKLERKALKKKRDLDTIFYYDLATGTLTTPSLSRSYGTLNLYRDPKNTLNVDYLECKFSELEQQAAWVIKSIHNGLQFQSFTISRAELSTIRKFIFLMHYRSASLSSTYFQEDNPKNAALAEWIRKYKERRQLSTEADIWRDGLKYYLEHTHQEIVTAAERIRARYGADRFHEMLRRGVDPDLEEEWYAVDYESQANYFFLGVWEAADNAEFILGGNGFGLWEGHVYRSPGAHKLYVVSPRVAIVLRRTILHHPHSNDPSALQSSLADVDIYSPEVQYADQTVASDVAHDMAKRIAYRSSPQALKDIFKFPITKLTDEETYLVNEVVLMNADAHQNGSVTFASPTTMLNTLQMYMASHHTFVGGKKYLFQPLIQELLKIPTSDDENPLPPDISPTLDADTDADLQLNILLRFTIANAVQYPSQYNRAYLIYRMATDAVSLSNSVSHKIREICEEGISKLELTLPPPRTSSLSARTETISLVETMSKEESDIFFARFGAQIDNLEIGKRSNDSLANIIYEAAIIGIAMWLAKTRPDVLADFLQPWLRITA